ncbi:MAG: hypothetical protein JF595_09940 [Sphingomonadales bacterium]|nr:hypothetical protein [Sphingomonadales bacterium]
MEFAKNGAIFENIGICNPGTGLVAIIPIAQFAQEVAGVAPVLLFQNMIEAFSANLVSL